MLPTSVFGVPELYHPRLLRVLDRASHWLYPSRSPLDWLNRRCDMRVLPRKPGAMPPNSRLLDGNDIGLAEFGATGIP